tara:strand:- start:1029 stop:1265 length:237 start_codon:yes stop_codon:yes gene_type:complete
MITIDSLYDLYKTDYDTLLNGVIFIHIFIIIIIFGEYLKNPKSIHYPITRIQLLFLILSLWIFIMINNNDLKEKYNDY